MEQEVHDLGCEYKEYGNMKCFENLIIVSRSIICNIIYDIMKYFSFIYKCRHNWLNHFKILCTFVCDCFIFIFLN